MIRNKVVGDVVKDNVTYEQTLAERMTAAAQDWAYGDKTPKENEERIKAPFREISEFARSPNKYIVDALTPPSIRQAQTSWGGKQEIPPSANRIFSVPGAGFGIQKLADGVAPLIRVGVAGIALPFTGMGYLDNLSEDILGKPYWDRESPEEAERWRLHNTD